MVLGVGAAYGTAKSGIGISGVGTFRPDLIMKVYTNQSCYMDHTDHCSLSSQLSCPVSLQSILSS